MKRSTAFLGAAACSSAGFVVQAVSLARYIARAPADSVGIGLYGATLVAFALAAAGFAIRWRRERRWEREHTQPPSG